MEIFKLIGSIMVDTADAENSISKTDEKAKGLAEKMGDGVKTAAKWGAGIATAAIAVGGAMVTAAKSTAADMDAIDKASIRMGLGAEQYQELAYAAGLCGVEMSTMESAAKKLEGTDLNLDDALTQIMSIGDESERTQAAIELFGEGLAYKMTPLLQAGTDGMAEMRQEANDLGLVMSQEAVTNGAAMGDMFSKVEQSISTLKNTLVSELMPYVMEIMQWVIDNIPKIKDTVESVMSAVMPIIKAVLDALMIALPALFDLFTGIMDKIIPYVEPIVTGISSLFSGLFSLLSGDVSGAVENFKNAFTGLGTAMFNIGADIFNSLWNGLSSVWDGIAGWLNGVGESITGWFSGIGNSISNFFGGGEAHASGLPLVPYDNYPALLHRGETVLNANNTSELLDLIRTGGNSSNDSAPINITVQSVLDGKVVGESVARYNRQKARAYG